MYTAHLAHRSPQHDSLQRRGSIIIVLVVLASLIFNSQTVSASLRSRPANLSVTSLLGLDDLAKKTLDHINQVISNANAQVKGDLTQLTTDVNGIIDKLDNTYKDLLNVSIDNLDVTIQSFATTVASQLDNINTMLNQDLANVQAALHTAIQDFHNQIGQLLAQFETSASKIIVQVTQSATFVIDRAAWDAIGIGAIVLLLLGLLILAAAIIVSKGWPSGAGGIIAGVLVLLFVVIGVLLAFVPSVKAQALKSLGKGQDVPTIPIQPQIFDVEPNPVILISGQTQELRIIGVHLQLDNGSTPVVTINNVTTAIHAASDTQIVIAAPTSGTATVQLTLTYNSTQHVGAPISLATPTPVLAPALIMISNFHVDPANPVANVTSVHAYVTVKNTGGMTSKLFNIIWKPRSGDQKNIGGTLTLAPNETRNLTSDGYIYPNSGTFSVEVDSSSTEMGSNPVFLSTQVNVIAPTATPSPQTFQYTTPTGKNSSGYNNLVNHPSCGFTCGHGGGDVLNLGGSAGTGCTITSVYLELYDSDGKVLQQTVPPFTLADQGNPSHYTGEITNDPRGGNVYTTDVTWGGGPNVSANYRIDYTVQGYNCSAPPNTVQ